MLEEEGGEGEEKGCSDSLGGRSEGSRLGSWGTQEMNRRVLRVGESRSNVGGPSQLKGNL